MQRSQATRDTQRDVRLLLEAQHTALLMQHVKQAHVQQFGDDAVRIEAHAHKQNDVRMARLAQEFHFSHEFCPLLSIEYGLL